MAGLALLEIVQFDFINTPGGIKTRRSIYSIYSIYSILYIVYIVYIVTKVNFPNLLFWPDLNANF